MGCWGISYDIQMLNAFFTKFVHCYLHCHLQQLWSLNINGMKAHMVLVVKAPFSSPLCINLWFSDQSIWMVAIFSFCSASSLAAWNALNHKSTMIRWSFSNSSSLTSFLFSCNNFSWTGTFLLTFVFLCNASPYQFSSPLSFATHCIGSFLYIINCLNMKNYPIYGIIRLPHPNIVKDPWQSWPRHPVSFQSWCM